MITVWNFGGGVESVVRMLPYMRPNTQLKPTNMLNSNASWKLSRDGKDLIEELSVGR